MLGKIQLDSGRLPNRTHRNIPMGKDTQVSCRNSNIFSHRVSNQLAELDAPQDDLSSRLWTSGEEELAVGLRFRSAPAVRFGEPRNASPTTSSRGARESSMSAPGALLESLRAIVLVKQCRLADERIAPLTRFAAVAQVVPMPANQRKMRSRYVGAPCHPAVNTLLFTA